MSELSETVFDKILAGEIPCHRLYEDEHVLAFLDVSPLSRGHTLVIPKERKAHLHELSDESAANLGRILPRLCKAVLKASGATAYNVLQNNGAAAHQAVMHVHFHIIPKLGHTGLGIGWKASGLDDCLSGLGKNLKAKGWVGIELDPAAGGARRFCEALQAEGLLCKETHTHVIRFAPPLGITREELDWALERMEKVLSASVTAT